MTEEHKILDDWSTELFVGNNYEYYKNKWRDKPERQSFSSWNWPAFLFPVYWLAYRKMYLEAFFVCGDLSFFSDHSGERTDYSYTCGNICKLLLPQKRNENHCSNLRNDSGRGRTVHKQARRYKRFKHFHYHTDFCFSCHCGYSWNCLLSHRRE